MNLYGKTALVTGGASGIGAVCARRLAFAGARVVVLDVRSDGAKQIAEEIGGEALFVDLADLGMVESALEGLEADIVVNNAGVQHLALLDEFPPAEFDRLLTVMLLAPFRITRAVLPGMYARGWGRFVHVTSIRGVLGDVRKGAYVAAKHGVEGLSKTIALEGAKHGVTSNCIAPAWVETPLTYDLANRQAHLYNTTPERIVEDVMLGGAAIKELVSAEEIAELVAHLCSPAARHTTGTSIPVDGGWLAG
ncbi:SDR family oxidoreductase [Saccharopolyspora sp. ID03-671]|uniref:SDR family oxidoreductase n=1 Tax=Saccharopolyspora sp. ID03-671 TaxID=3073066 RepID=UPI0032501EE9